MAGEPTAMERYDWLAAALIAVLAVAIYLPTLRNGYVFDDEIIVRRNPIVTQEQFGEALTAPYWPALEGITEGAPNWRPLAVLSLVLDRRVPGGVPLVHHAVNVMLYGLVVLTLLPVARRLAGRGWPALMALGLFAAHPAHTQVVSPIVGRTDLLAALGTLVALECFLRFRESPESARGRAWWLWLGASAWAVGLGGKESAAPLLLVLPAADWLLLGRRGRELVGRSAMAYLPFLAVAVLYAVARVAVLGGAALHSASTADYYTVPERLLFAGHNAVVSVGLLAAPVRFAHAVTTLPDNAAFTYPDPTGPAALAFAAGGLVIGLGWLALVRRAPRFAFVWLAALLTWLPTSGLIPAAAGVSMRFLFLPSAFAACGVALGAAIIGRDRPALGRVMSVLLVVGIMGGVGLSVWRARTLRNNGTFYRAVIAEAPGCVAAHHNLGAWYATGRRPDLDKARDHYAEAARIAGETEQGFTARLNLAITCEMNSSGERYGRGAPVRRAEEIYRELIEVAPDRADAYLNLAILLERRGLPAAALGRYREFLSRAPDHPRRDEVLQRVQTLSQR
jgi:tetratricopeptide (TPR) repeat protein